MNDGFIVVWLFSMAAILYFTGWEKLVADGLSLRVVLPFLGAVALLQMMQLAIQEEVVVTGGAVLAIGTASLLWATMRAAGSMLFVLFTALLTGFMWSWMGYIYSMDPVFVALHPKWDGPLLAGIFAGLLADRFRSHFVIVVFGALVALGHHFIGAGGAATPVVVGSLAWWDGAAIALTAARVVSSVKVWIKEKTLRFAQDRAGEREGST